MVSINLYRRHARSCEGKHAFDSFTSEPEERRKGFARCHCPIFASGTFQLGEFRRVSTRKRSWDEARQAIEPYLKAGSWDLAAAPPPEPPPPVAPPPPAPKPETKGTALKPAIVRYLDSLERNQTADSTIRKYKTVLLGKGGLVPFGAARGITTAEAWTRRLTRDLADSWPVEPSTRTTKLGFVKPFFERLVEDEILASNPARIRQHVNRATRASSNKPRCAYSEAQLERMFAICRKDYGANSELRKWPKQNGVIPISDYKNYVSTYSGDDVADFFEISVATGLRFQDVAQFHIDRLTGNEVQLRAEKNGAWVSVLVATDVAEMIRRRARRFGPYIFGDPTNRTPNSIYVSWYKRFHEVWGQMEWDAAPGHHRFRHTFVRRHLQNGTPVAIVARLIGDTEKTVLTHYSQWVPELQQALIERQKAVVNAFPRYR